MDVLSAIKARRSIRKYEKRPIPKEVMEDLLDSAKLAPSANNLQRFHVVVVTDDRVKERLVKVCGGQEFIADCYAFLVGVNELGAFYSCVDMTIALDHLSLRAVELGLGTCWIGDFEPDKVKDILDIPGDREIPICMTLGYPAQSPPARRRKALSEIFLKDKWGNGWD